MHPNMATPSMKPTFQPRVLRSYTKWMQSPFVEEAAFCIQRWWRVWRSLKPHNTHDFITLEPLEAPVFLHVSPTRHVTAFSAHPLAQYFEAAGDFQHPQTRTPFNHIEIKRLDRITQYQYKLHTNYQTLLQRHSEERKTEELRDFLLNDFKTCYQACIECCHPDISQRDWALRMRERVDLLTASVVSLQQFNHGLANAVLTQCITEINNILYTNPVHLFMSNTIERVIMFQTMLRNLLLFTQ